MEITALLCDWAEAINGKLYIQGGGWNVLVAGQPVTIAIAILVRVDWDRGNERHALGVELLDHDAAPVLLEDNPVQMTGEFEVGRPPGIKPGTQLNVPFGFRFQGLPLAPGGYDFRVTVNGGEAVASLPFSVGTPPG